VRKDDIELFLNFDWITLVGHYSYERKY